MCGIKRTRVLSPDSIQSVSPLPLGDSFITFFVFEAETAVQKFSRCVGAPRPSISRISWN